MKPDPLESVKQIAADLFDVAIDELTPDSSPATIEAWDSMQTLNLVLALEQEFEVQLAPEDVEQLRSIGATAEIIRRKLADQSTRIVDTKVEL